MDLKQTIISITLAVLAGLARSWSKGKRDFALLIEGFAAFLVGWIVHFVLLQFTNFDFGVIAGFTGVSGWISTKILERFETITDTAADRIEDEIESKDKEN